MIMISGKNKSLEDLFFENKMSATLSVDLTILEIECKIVLLNSI